MPLSFYASGHTFTGNVLMTGNFSVNAMISAKEANFNTTTSAQIALALQDNKDNAHKLLFAPNLGTGNYNTNIQSGDLGILQITGHYLLEVQHLP